jgi:uncharacterized protein YndB with AHSA1/START domain
MTTATETGVTTQTYRVYIKATPQAIWDAITKPEWTGRYGYRGRAEYELRPGGAYSVRAPESMLAMGAPEVLIRGEVLELDPPRKLVQTWGALWDPNVIAEGPRRLTWEIADAGFGVSALTVTHELEGAPKTAAQVGSSSTDLASGAGGWAWIVSDLKSLLERGSSLCD